MNYHGKLYGKVGKKHFELEMTTQDIEALQAQNEALKNELAKLKGDTFPALPAFSESEKTCEPLNPPKNEYSN